MHLRQLGPLYWRARLKSWPARQTVTEGYSLLMPVPGDLPVFLRLALAVCRPQQSEHRVETIVLPDRMTPEMRQIVSRARPDWPGDLYLQPLPVPERWVLPRLGDPGRNHAVQLFSGVARSRATHFVLHDADLFLLEADVLDRQFKMCRDRQLACLGISPPWDPWFAQHGQHLAATWELCADVGWARKYAPALHMAHKHELFGEEHTFDTTFYPQALTDQELIAVSSSDDTVHFNYVISNYRYFGRRGASQWHDNRFRLLLISLLVELFDQENWPRYQLPSLVEMAGYLGNQNAPVTFPEDEKGKREYRSFRELMGRALTGPWLSSTYQELASGALAPFDRFYGPDGASAVDVGSSYPGGSTT